MKNQTITVHPLSAHTGAEITGVDLARPLSDQTYLEIREAFNQWGAIFFRDQDITPTQQLEFARRFGTVKPDDYASNLPPVDGYEELKEIVRSPDDARNVGGFWHMDKCFMPDPDMASLLYAKELPPYGGDTMFAHLGAAFDALSPGLQATLETLSTVLIKSRAYGDGGTPAPGVTAEGYAAALEKFAGMEATHPAVARHPETGRKVLFVGPVYSDRFAGWTRAESLPLLDYLSGIITRPEHTCRFRWEEGSIAMWDNRAVAHYALDDYPGHRRAMHRVTIQGPWLDPTAAAA
ncbi:MAG: TauD/TfdA family dioxygenase [Alphaproteobacteria bacterium]|nr:TauD/TfdA family dioxygenase [Alphaproteobacteria bacterium]